MKKLINKQSRKLANAIRTNTPKKQKAVKKASYVYTEKDLGEGLLYMGLSASRYLAFG